MLLTILSNNRPGPQYSIFNIQWLPQVSEPKLHHTSRTLLTNMFISTVSPIHNVKYMFPLYECAMSPSCSLRVSSRSKNASAPYYQAAVERNGPASLLEQQTTDIFSTSIGNIPAFKTVKVEIECTMELLLPVE